MKREIESMLIRVARAAHKLADNTKEKDNGLKIATPEDFEELSAALDALDLLEGIDKLLKSESCGTNFLATTKEPRPFVQFRPRLKQVSTTVWKAIYGDVEAFGSTPELASNAFDLVWRTGKQEPEIEAVPLDSGGVIYVGTITPKDIPCPLCGEFTNGTVKKCACNYQVWKSPS